MLNLTVAGRLGRDAKVTQTQGGDDICTFSVAADVGYGDRKQTIWIDVSRWGKGARQLADYLRKGTPVAASGELSMREYEGKTYLQLRADKVTLLGSKDQGDTYRGERKKGYDAPADDYDDLDGSIPF